MRHDLRRWLADRGVDHRMADDIVLATSEALANAAEHGSGGSSTERVHLEARVEPDPDRGSEVVVKVTDTGRWQAANGSNERGTRAHHRPRPRRRGRRRDRRRDDRRAPATARGGGLVNVVVTPPAHPSEPARARISGELDVVSVPDVLERVPALVAADAGLVVDLPEVTFLDSSGVRFLHRLSHACAAAGTGMRVVAPPACRARRVLDIVGMDLLVDDDHEAARDRLRVRDEPGPP